MHLPLACWRSNGRAYWKSYHNDHIYRDSQKRIKRPPRVEVVTDCPSTNMTSQLTSWTTAAVTTLPPTAATTSPHLCGKYTTSGPGGPNAAFTHSLFRLPGHPVRHTNTMITNSCSWETNNQSEISNPKHNFVKTSPNNQLYILIFLNIIL